MFLKKAICLILAVSALLMFSGQNVSADNSDECGIAVQGYYLTCAENFDQECMTVTTDNGQIYCRGKLYMKAIDVQ